MDLAFLSWVASVILTLCVCGVGLSKFIIFVRPCHSVVIVRGDRRGVLRHGWHFVPPLWNISLVHWTYTSDEDNGLKRVSVNTCQIPEMERQMDVPPFKVLTEDRIQVQIDGVLHYQIIDVVTAVHKNDNLLGLLETRLESATLAAAAQFNSSTMHSVKSQLEKLITEQVNEIMASFGVRIMNYVITDIVMDSKILQVNEERKIQESKNVHRETEARLNHQHQLNQIAFDKAKQRAEHEKQMDDFALQIRKAETQQLINQNETEANIHLAMLDHEAEMKKSADKQRAEVERLKDFLGCGFTHEQAIHIQSGVSYAKAVAESTSGLKTLVASPQDWRQFRQPFPSFFPRCDAEGEFKDNDEEEEPKVSPLSDRVLRSGRSRR